MCIVAAADVLTPPVPTAVTILLVACGEPALPVVNPACELGDEVVPLVVDSFSSASNTVDSIALAFHDVALCELPDVTDSLTRRSCFAVGVDSATVDDAKFTASCELPLGTVDLATV
jgi:hypothetical protein